MSGLVFKVAPGERFIINGATLENGDKPARIRRKSIRRSSRSIMLFSSW